jgi:hypothetical protein
MVNPSKKKVIGHRRTLMKSQEGNVQGAKNPVKGMLFINP